MRRGLPRIRGVSLVESLVALAVLSAGLLGVAALQVSGLRANGGAYYRTQATALAADLAERIRANPAAARDPAGPFAGFTAGSGAGGCAPARVCAAELGAAAADCTPAEMASYDLVAIACGVPDASGVRVGGVDDLLPRGVLRVSALPAEPGRAAVRYAIVIGWNEQERCIAGCADATRAAVGSTAATTDTAFEVRLELEP